MLAQRRRGCAAFVPCTWTATWRSWRCRCTRAPRCWTGWWTSTPSVRGHRAASPDAANHSTHARTPVAVHPPGPASVHEAEPEVLQGIMADIVSAVAELHERGIVHGRLDAQSVVLTENTAVQGCSGEARRVLVGGANEAPEKAPPVAARGPGRRPAPVRAGHLRPDVWRSERRRRQRLGRRGARRGRGRLLQGVCGARGPRRRRSDRGLRRLEHRRDHDRGLQVRTG